MRRWWLPAALAIVSMGSAAVAVYEPGALAPAVPATPPKVPVLSPRRVPVALAGAIADARLRSRLDAALADPAFRRSCLVVDRDGLRLYDARPDERLVPASNLKLLTGFAALTRLGPETRFTTEARSTRPPSNGVLDGDLFLIGGGDPLLGTADYAATFRNQPQVFTPLERLADEIKAQGITAVTGAVRGDESRYDQQRYGLLLQAKYSF